MNVWSGRLRVMPLAGMPIAGTIYTHAIHTYKVDERLRPLATTPYQDEGRNDLNHTAPYKLCGPKEFLRMSNRYDHIECLCIYLFVSYNLRLLLLLLLL